MSKALCTAFVVFLGAPASAALEWVERPALTFDKSSRKWQVTFELSQFSDVEVAILDEQGRVVRHLAAGVLGRDPPRPLIADSKAQTIQWDGEDDYGTPVTDPGKMVVRVRAGMRVSLEKIVGGDPYAFYSKEMGQGDHAGWDLTGLEAKADGKVYVLGNVNNYGPPALRAFDAAGNYLHTVYPPPAGKELDQVKGWGIYEKEDGTYSFQYNDLSSPAVTRTFVAHNRADIASLIPSAAQDRLLLRGGKRNGHRLMHVNTDGTIPLKFDVEGDLVNEPPMRHPETNAWKIPWRLVGPTFVCLAPDGKRFYLSGAYAATMNKLDIVGAEKMGFWRDGQVYEVDLATRKATVFFATAADEVITTALDRAKSPIADTKYSPCAAFQGVAVDKEGRVFVCDRQNKRVLILDHQAKPIREIPVAYPDAVAVSPKSKTLYVTTRCCNWYHKLGKLGLLKFNDWSQDSEPSVSLPLGEVVLHVPHSLLAVVESKGKVYVWVAYTTLPVHVYAETETGLDLVKDFYEAGTKQRCLDLQHLTVDQQTGDVYVPDGFGNCFKIKDWQSPRFERCMTSEEESLRAISLAIDHRNGYFYAHHHMSPVMRYTMDGEFFVPAPVGDTGENAVTPHICNDWRIRLGRGDRGLAVAPDGSLATLGALQKGGANYSGPLHFYRADPAKALWTPLFFENFGENPRSAGIRFDSTGNLYAGKVDGKPENPPPGYQEDRTFLESTGRIYRYARTGEPGNLFRTAPEQPSKVYDIHYGAVGPHFSRTPRFAVDGYGRIYYPTSLLPKVSVIDNEGNPVLSFGTWGNRDSMGGLKGDLVPTKDIPLGWPNSVDATDDHIYIGDIVNCRLLRIAKTFAVEATAP